MIAKEEAVVGAKVAIPTQKTAGTCYEKFTAELAGCRLEWDSQKQEIYRVPHPAPMLRKVYELPYLLIADVRTFADTGGLCIILKRADGVCWLGNDTFADEDVTIYQG